MICIRRTVLAGWLGLALLPGCADGPGNEGGALSGDAASPALVNSDELDAGPVAPPVITVRNPQGVCETRTIDTSGALPDMLVVLDRSLSMSLLSRWEPSKLAVKTITRDYGALIRFGLSAFPGDVAACSAGTLEVSTRQSNAAPIASRLDALQPIGFTPTGAALSQALEVLGKRDADAEAARPAYVLLVTDGEPSCSFEAGSGDLAQQEAARSAVKALKEANVPTYVIGFQIEPAFQPLMNELAQLGGTATYRPVERAEEIVATFAEITKDLIRCSFELAEIPTDPAYVRVTLDGTTLALNAANGWSIDGKAVTLQGTACSKLKNGKGHIVKADVECAPIVLK